MKTCSILFCAAFAVGVAGATDFVWVGGGGNDDWNNANNWRVEGLTASYPQTEEDSATFPAGSTSTVNVTADVTVGRLILNGDITHRRDKWLTVGAVEGSGKINLQNRARLRNIAGKEVTIANEIAIANMDAGQDVWLQGNNANLVLTGPITGEGRLFLTMSKYFGVHLAGDSTGFKGETKFDGNSMNRAKICTETAVSPLATLVFNGAVPDCGSATFGGGTLKIGGITTPQANGGAYWRFHATAADKVTTLEIGHLNHEHDVLGLTLGDAGKPYVKIVKVGTGALELFETRHRSGTVIEEGTLIASSAKALSGNGNASESFITFAGGTLKYGGDATGPVTTDWSAHVANSTAEIAVDTDGKDVLWNSESILGNNPEMVGITKKGEGTLTLGSWRMANSDLFKSAAYTNRIEGGVLAIKNANRNQTPAFGAKILGMGTLRLDTFENDAGFRFYANGALEEFEGTLDWASAESIGAKAVGFLNQRDSLNLAQMRLVVSANPANADTRIMNNEINNGVMLTVDAFEHLHSNAVISFNNASILSIAGEKWDSYLNGTLTGGAVSIVKNGPKTLKIGKNFTPGAATVRVNEGVLELERGVVLADLDYLTVADGVAYAGEGSFGAVDLSKHDVAVPDITQETADKEVVYDVFTADSFTGTSANLTNLCAQLNEGETKGRWKYRIVTRDGKSTIQLYWAPRGLAIILR